MGFRLTQIGAVVLKGYEEDDIFGRIIHEGRFFEQEILELWEPWYREAQVIVDVGANLGNHSVYWATHTKARQIIAFEPYGLNFELLKSNIARNGLTQVICEQKAAGSRSGQVRLAEPVELQNLGNASFCYCEDQASLDEEIAEAVSLDEYKKETKLERVDFVKIDTEGFELEVLCGMPLLLQEFHPAVWTETGPAHAQRLIQYMEGQGYFLADVQEMNCLFLHPQRFPDAEPISAGKLLAVLLGERERAIRNEIKYGELRHRWLLWRREKEGTC